MRELVGILSIFAVLLVVIVALSVGVALVMDASLRSGSEECYYEGVLAGEKGMPPQACPYTSNRYRDKEWKTGWQVGYEKYLLTHERPPRLCK